MECLKYGYLIALLCEVARASKTGGAGAYDSNSVTVGLGTNGLCGCKGVVPVSNESLKTSDTYALALDAANALGLTLGLLGAYTAANCGERGGL